MADPLFLDDEAALDPARVGAKAATLARLRRRGLPVPDGFVLLPGETWELPRLSNALGRLRGAVAVRSSSTAEDLEAASFAGQYKTILGVRGPDEVLHAAAACRESAAAAGGYARVMGAPEGRMAVLVQELVEPVAAGVAFSRSPRDPARVLVEAVRGRGDRLMSGIVSPDRYELDRATGARLAGPPDGSLDASACEAVFNLLLRVEGEMGSPQDIEWALRAGPAREALVLLQARPITAADEAPPPGLARLTRANIGEVLPDPVTPLTFSTIGGFLEHAFRTVLARAGLLAPDAPPMVVRHLERLYLNLTLALDVAARMPLVSAADAERLILGAGATAGAAPPRPRLAGLGTAVRLMALGATKARLVRESERLVLSLPSAERTLAANAASLVAQLDQWLEVGRQVATTHILASGASGATLSLLRRLVAWLAPGDSAARVARLTAGLQGVASAAPTIALEELAARASEREDWQAWIQSGRELESAPHLLRLELRAFLDQYGHRALGEGELSAAAWEDDPSPVLEALRGLLAGAGRSRRARSTQVETRRAEEEALLSRRSPLVFAILRGALSSAHAGVREREHTKSLSVKVAGHGRRLARAAARRLVEAGHLAREADVFFLEWPELRQALDAGVAPGHGLLARRKRRHAREGSLPAPREVDLGRGRPLEEGGAVVSGATVQQGIGVSPGTGRGRVRILRPGQPPRLEPGEVLVAPVLDAALGPLLASAAAAVAEMGGVLSHGSVVARELGVPCVVDVRQALETLKDGELVEVDGDRGEVRRVGQGELALALEGATAADDDGSSLVAEDTTRELFSSGLPSGQRESVYFNIGDSTSGLKIIATVGVRAGGRGESVLALSLPDGRILFGLDRAPAATTSRTLRVAGAHVETGPVRLHWQTRLSVHEGSAFPPAPTPLLLAPRTAAVELELTLHPSGPAIDFCRQLTPARREALRSMGDHHVEQSGRFVGRVKVLEREIQVDAEGSRDHSWGPRDWAALDYSRLFVARFGDDLALQALTLAVRGEVVDGGFLWRGGRAERVARILYSVEREQGAPRSFEVEVRTAGGEGFWMRGLVERTLVVPVQLERRAWRHLVGRPYSLLLQENFVRWEAGTRSGLGVAEFSVRP